MLLPPFRYAAPLGVDEALSLRAGDPDAAYFAGGTDLLPQMRAGRRSPRLLIDVKRIAELSSIAGKPDGALAIGAAVSLAEIGEHPAVRTRYSLLATCCGRVGAWPLQCRATMIGNICNASPAADTAVALLALDALVETRSVNGAGRTIPIGGFFAGPGRTALEHGELVLQVLLPPESSGWNGTYLRLSRRRGMDLATIGVLVARSNGAGPVRHRIVLASVAPTPLRVPEAESCLDREGPGGAERAAAIARGACSPITDLRGSANYRREMVGVLVRRGVAALA